MSDTETLNCRIEFDKYDGYKDNAETVFVADAIKDNEVIERIVHTTYDDAEDDIVFTSRGEDPDRIRIDEQKVWLGYDDEFVVTR